MYNSFFQLVKFLFHVIVHLVCLWTGQIIATNTLSVNFSGCTCAIWSIVKKRIHFFYKVTAIPKAGV